MYVVFPFPIFLSLFDRLGHGLSHHDMGLNKAHGDGWSEGRGQGAGSGSNGGGGGSPGSRRKPRGRGGCSGGPAWSQRSWQSGKGIFQGWVTRRGACLQTDRDSSNRLQCAEGARNQASCCRGGEILLWEWRRADWNGDISVNFWLFEYVFMNVCEFMSSFALGTEDSGSPWAHLALRCWFLSTILH